MWPHAVRHATVARNRVLTKVADDMWVPLERWLGKKPPVDMLRVFGCMAVAHVPKPYRTKLGASALWKQIGGGTKDWVKVKEWVNPTIYPARTRMATRKLLSSTSGGATTEQQEQAQGEDAVLFLGDDQDSSDKEIDGVQRKLTEQFKCKSLGEARYYLGMHIERDTERGWLKLHQGQYINTLAEKYSLQEEREVVTPLPSEFKLIKAAEGEGVESEDQRQFQSMAGSLLYAALQS
ncbi:hypothetical protein CLOP_g8536 [Closterium sp. NIES-67]|nr:hypothetical protein CLOP_g8536 [Closterium sp. NIES-67]